MRVTPAARRFDHPHQRAVARKGRVNTPPVLDYALHDFQQTALSASRFAVLVDEKDFHSRTDTARTQK